MLLTVTSSYTFSIIPHTRPSKPPSAMSFTSELKNKDTLLRRQALVDDVIYKLQESSLTDASEDCDESQNIVLLRGYGG